MPPEPPFAANFLQLISLDVATLQIQTAHILLKTCPWRSSASGQTQKPWNTRTTYVLSCIVGSLYSAVNLPCTELCFRRELTLFPSMLKHSEDASG